MSKRKSNPTSPARPQGLHVHGVGISIVILLAIAFLLLSAHFVAKAQSYCAPYDSVVGHLRDKYQEVRAVVAAGSNGTMMEILVSPKGTWTQIFVHPDGRACLYASGDGWQPAREKGSRS